MTLNDWFVPPGTINHLLPMEHNHGIVLLSVLIAILTSAMALQIAGLARLSRTRSTRHLAIATGALAMGGGIWAMHFIAMLAMKIPVQFHYDPLLTLLSMLPGLAAEYKDNETGLHVIRMSRYTQLLARAAGFSDADAERILHAAPMHDVGKIGIPDAILRKPGKLDADEWQVMQTHAAIGGRIIGQHSSGLLKMAHDIAVSHHEKWDGSGYPAGLAGTDIPLEGRIVAIADVFDALTSERPYKKAWPVEQAVQLLRDEAGKHFDPELVPLFIELLPQVLQIKEQWAEERA